MPTKKQTKQEETAEQVEQEEQQEQQVPAEETAEQEQKEAAKDPGNATVYDQRNRHIRVYSLETHGKQYRKMAEQFASKINGEVR